MKQKLNIIELSLAAVIAAALLVGAAVEHQSEGLAAKFIRLHVIANSDTAADQALKLRVRDRVLSQMEGIISPDMSRDQAAAAINARLKELEDAALLESGAYPVTVTLSGEYYPTREYDSFSLPAGEYLSLRVMIGEAQGKNWWCVVFPPLCTDLCVEDAESVWGLSADEAALITGEEGYVIRFRLMEWWAELKNSLS